MSVQAVHAVVHTPEQVREILLEAARIADDCQAQGVDRVALFDKACDLLGARATTFLVPQQVPFDLSGLKANGG